MWQLSDRFASDDNLAGWFRVADNPESFTPYDFEAKRTVIYNRNTQSALLQQVDANRFVSWTTGYYYFPEQSLEAILYRLSHVYGVQFTVKSEALNHRTFTGTFYRGQSIKDIIGNYPFVDPDPVCDRRSSRNNIRNLNKNNC